MQQPSQTHTTGKAVGKLSGHLTSSERWALLDTVRAVLSGTSPHQSAPNQVPFPQVLPARHYSYHRFYVRLWEIHRDLTASSTILSSSAQQFFKGRVRSAQKMTGIPLETHLKFFCKWLLGRGTKNVGKGINVHGCFPTCWCRQCPQARSNHAQRWWDELLKLEELHGAASQPAPTLWACPVWPPVTPVSHRPRQTSLLSKILNYTYSWKPDRYKYKKHLHRCSLYPSSEYCNFTFSLQTGQTGYIENIQEEKKYSKSVFSKE